MKPRFPGVLTALVTPFRDGRIDTDALERLVDDQVAAGVNGLVPCGSTVESATLSHEEHIDIIGLVVARAARRVPVIAGTGSNSTAEAIRLTRAAKDAGADAAPTCPSSSTTFPVVRARRSKPERWRGSPSWTTSSGSKRPPDRSTSAKTSSRAAVTRSLSMPAMMP
jgi:hypothetical protein